MSTRDACASRARPARDSRNVRRAAFDAQYGGLQRDAAVRERRADVQERAVALLQVRQRGPVAVDHPEEVDVEHAPQLVGLRARATSLIHRHHRVRDVRVDPAEPVDRLLDDLRDLVLRPSDRPEPRSPREPNASISRTASSSASPFRAVTTTFAPRLAGAARDRAPEPARGAGDDDDLLGQRLLRRAHRPAVPERATLNAMPEIGISGLIIILVVALLIFGPKRLPEIGRSLGRGMREFKDSVSGKDDDSRRVAAAPQRTTRRPPPADAMSLLPRRLRHGEEATLVEHLGELRARLDHLPGHDHGPPSP